MSGRNFVESFAVPGSSRVLRYEREATGRLVRLWSGNQVYLAGGDERTYGDGLARVREALLGKALVRHVRTESESWVEEYLFDDAGRPVRIDGVDIERDAQFRITRCRGEAGEWRYSYVGDQLTAIATPRVTRSIGRAEAGRPASLQEASTTLFFRYGEDGRRKGIAALPEDLHRDELGRLWTITKDGRVTTTFLWDGFACLGRIDGDVGAPLAACFSLDPTSTPVRVITRRGVTRIPRDAFGEALLAHEKVPGLYGGTIHGGFVHLRARVVDPFTGSFDRSDPWSGLADDPRRADGYDGALPVETPPCGPYAVAQYDAIGRADPTGEQSWAIILSDLTWSLQHNLGGWLGLDLTIGLAWSLVASFVQIFTKLARDQSELFGVESEVFISRYFDYEGLHNQRTGISAVRRGFFGAPGAFTYQHMVVARHEEFEDLDQIRVIDPGGLFEPTLYNTILRVDPVDATPFLLAGNRDAALGGWTRCGGAAVPIAPGSPMPRFPSGGIHLDTVLTDRAPRNCAITELVPSAQPVMGSFSSTAITVIVPSAAGISANDLVVLSDATGAVEIQTVATVTGNRLHFGEPATALQLTGVRLRHLGPSPATPVLETLSVPAGTTMRLAPAGGAVPVQPYQPGDVLRLNRNTQAVGFATVTMLEIAAAIDGPISFATIDDVRPAAIDPAGGTATLAGDTLTMPDAGDTLPAAGRDIVLTSITGALAGAHVNAGATATERKLDRTDLAAFAGKVGWNHLIASSPVSSSATALGSTLTYTAATLQSPPVPGFLIVRDQATLATTARNATGLIHAAVVLATEPPPGGPLDVQRFAIAAGAPDFPNLTLMTETRIALAASTPIAARAVQVVPLPAATLGPGPATVATGVASGAFIPIGTGVGARNAAPSRVVMIDDGTTTELALVRALRATLTLDRSVNVIGGEVSVVPLLASGPAYDGTLTTDMVTTSVVVAPTIGGGATLVQMPRFEEDSLVMIASGGMLTLWRVLSANGARLVLTGGPPTPAIANGPVSVQLFVPAAPNPANGTWRIGRNAAGGTGATTTLDVEIWNARHVAAGANVAIVQGTAAAQPAVISGVTAPAFTLDLIQAPALTGMVNVTSFNPAGVFYASEFTQTGALLTLSNVAGALPAAAAPVAVVPYDVPAAPAATVSVAQAAMGPGTVRVPDDAEKWEITRRDALTFHELTHTRQSAELGPLFLNWTPLFILNIIAEAQNRPDLPQWSPHVSAQFMTSGGQFFVVLSNPAALELAAGETVELSSSTLPPLQVVLGAAGNGGFRVDPPQGTLPGPVFLRKQLREGAGWVKTLYEVLKPFTIGGALGYVTGSTWGQLIRWLGDLWYWLTRRVFGTGDSFPATLQGTTLTMTTEEGKSAVQGFSGIFLISGGRTELVTVTAIDEGTLTLSANAGFADGEVMVRPYEALDRIDGLEYFDAAVENPTFPARVTVFPKNGRTPNLEVFTRVSVAAGLKSIRTNVAAVQADGRIDLDAIPPTTASNRLRIARVGQGDAVDGPESRHLTELGQGWMRWLFDPYAQLERTISPPRGTWYGEIAHYAPHAFSSRSFGLLPIPGWLFWDNFFSQWFGWFGTHGHASRMEQAASEESGELYSILGKLRGGFRENDDNFAQPDAVVGDLARYWLTSHFDVFARSQFDNPGTTVAVPAGSLAGMPAVENSIRVVPTASAETANNAFVPLNKNVAATDPNPGWFVPDVFFPKPNTGNPHATTSWVQPAPGTNPPTAVPAGFDPGARGLIPRSPNLQLSHGMYVGFCGPGRHRVTADDSIAAPNESREAHERERQTILFDVNVVDVGVVISGTPVPAVTAATMPASLPEVTLLVRQRAAVAVTVPDGFTIQGTWAVTAANPEAFVTTDNGPVIIAGATPGTDVVELSRMYSQTNGVYDDAVLSDHGVHLPVNVHVPVRLFTVNVIDTASMALVTAPAAPITTILPGQTGIVVIAANVAMSLALTAINYPAGTPVHAAEPVPQIGAGSTGIAGATAFNVEFPADQPPEDAAPMVFTTMVGTMANAVAVTTSVTLLPHFILTGPTLSAAPGSQLTLSDGVTAIAPPSVAVRIGDPAGITFSVSGTLITVTIDATAPPGARQIIATDAADATRRATRTIVVT